MYRVCCQTNDSCHTKWIVLCETSDFAFAHGLVDLDVDALRERLKLGQEGVPHHVIADNALASRMAAGEVDCVITGADRVAANGDVANKIGTYGVAVLCKHHGIPFYVAFPTSTVAMGTPDGAAIPIEERAADEVQFTWGTEDEGRFRRVRTTWSPARNPAFDVTPAALVTAFVTERGILEANAVGLAGIGSPHSSSSS